MVGEPGAPGTDTPAPAPLPPGAPEWTVDRVRSLLLWVGAALLAASALTFTAVAWSHLGDGGRAALLATVTGVFTGLALALRRRLPASAEAFTALSIALALIDWQALRRAGLTSGNSTSASWAIGTGVVAGFAFVLGRAVRARSSRVAIAILLPLSLELFVGTVANAAWSGALGLAIIAAGMVVGARVVSDRDRLVQGTLELHAFVTWSLAAVFAAIAAAATHVCAIAHSGRGRGHACDRSGGRVAAHALSPRGREPRSDRLRCPARRCSAVAPSSG